jgi:hypothetical protein
MSQQLEQLSLSLSLYRTTTTTVLLSKFLLSCIQINLVWQYRQPKHENSEARRLISFVVIFPSENSFFGGLSSIEFEFPPVKTYPPSAASFCRCVVEMSFSNS